MRWREGSGGPFLRTTFGRLVARVNFTGAMWRGTIWNKRGSSTCTHLTLSDAMRWCELELGQ